MSLGMKWADLLRYLRITVYVVLFLFLTGFVGFWVTGRDSSAIFYWVMIISIILLGVQLFVFVIFKLLQTEAMKERMDWITQQTRLPKGSKKLEELRLTVMDYQTEMKEKTCSICGLEFSERTPVIECLKCEKLFHRNHFIKWLQENESCPNCKNLILPFD